MGTHLQIWARTVFCAALLCWSAPGAAHPGGTASDGCHTCRTNCAKWGEKSGTRHCHGSTGEKRKEADHEAPKNLSPQKLRVRVEHVVDGDTLKVVTLGKTPKHFTVRLKGIDCPESHRNAKCVRDQDCDEDAPRGKRATKQMANLVDGEVVTLVSAGAKFEKDVHGRTLAYVHLGGTDVGLHLIAGGFCQDFSHRYPHPRQRQYKRAEK